MNKLNKFYQYLGIEETFITPQQVFCLMCLLRKEQPNITLFEDPVAMMEHVISLYIDKIETGSFRYITEEQITQCLKNGKYSF